MDDYSSVQAGGNVVDYPFWEDGYGANFRSVNMAHLHSGTSTERLTYAPNYNQQYFDTTLNKMLVCTNPSTKEWRDFNGNIVE